MEGLVLKMMKTVGHIGILKKTLSKLKKRVRKEIKIEQHLEDFVQRHWTLSLMVLFVLVPIVSVVALFLFVAAVMLPVACIVGWI